jgi:hypothetical protein
VETPVRDISPDPPHPYRLCLHHHRPQSRTRFFSSVLCGEKNLSGTRRYQAVPAGTKRYDTIGQPLTDAETRPPSDRAQNAAAGASLLPLRKELGERAGARPEGLRANVIGFRPIPHSAIRAPNFQSPVSPVYRDLSRFSAMDTTFFTGLNRAKRLATGSARSRRR